MLKIEGTEDRGQSLVNEMHVICHHEGTSFKGLRTLDRKEGLYRSEDWPISRGDPRKLEGGYLYLHDTSAKASTFAAQILEVIPVKATKTNVRVALVVRRVKEHSVPWRGKKPNQTDPAGGIVSRPLNHH
jgi:hypothetical protein